MKDPVEGPGPPHPSHARDEPVDAAVPAGPVAGRGTLHRGLEPVTLTGDVVTLEPLRRDHIGALATAVSDGRLWELWYTTVPTPEGMAADVEARLAQREAGTMLPFVVRRNDTGAVVGATTY